LLLAAARIQAQPERSLDLRATRSNVTRQLDRFLPNFPLARGTLRIGATIALPLRFGLVSTRSRMRLRRGIVTGLDGHPASVTISRLLRASGCFHALLARMATLWGCIILFARFAPPRPVGRQTGHDQGGTFCPDGP